MRNYRQLYEYGLKKLEEAQIEEAQLEARLLLEFICNTTRNELLVYGDREVSDEKCERYYTFIEKRMQRIPLQHITGFADFMGLIFHVNQNVLIPRFDTEVLVEEVLKQLHDRDEILDMCTGSGCILISLLQYSNNTVGLGVDLSEDALKVARENAKEILGIKENVSFGFLSSNLFESVPKKQYDIIVSNPPYIRTKVIETLMTEVKDHEPMMALDGYEDGLYFYREISKNAKDYLKQGGKLFFEIGYDQGVEVSEIMKENGFINIEVKKDLARLDRVVYGERK
ncbi:MAG: peptide chain release factor N(5)-glutamine methyltransferase [Lachnospiraceae bacterium]